MEHFEEVMKFIITLASFAGVLVALFNKLFDNKIQPIKDELESTKNMVVQSIEETEKSDLGVVRSRLQHINKRIKMGDDIDIHEIASCHHDLDRYDYLKEKYQYITYGAKKVKINGEVEEARRNIEAYEMKYYKNLTK